ncbi:MAG: HlyD family efflux transporter periplasmic adaptor subunit, partial [Desulfoferrobacter sp.]
MQEHKEKSAARQQSESVSPAETDTSPAIPSRRRVLALGRGIPLLIFILAAAVCLFLGGRWLQYYLGHASTDDARVKGDLIKISSTVQGKIRLLPIQEGEHVKKGQLIAQLREEVYQASVDEAEGAVRAIQGELSEAQEELDLLKHKRQKEDADSEVEQNRFKLELGKVNSSDVISKQNRVEALNGRLKEAAAVLEAARLKLAHTCVTSPIDGVIAKKVGNLGEVVKPGQPIAIVVDLANLWVEAN